MKIFHIAPHLGGGVGRFFSNIVRADIQNLHEFCLLEPPIDTHLLVDISWQLFNDIQDNFNDHVKKFDIVQIEFWNHPLLYKFLIEQKIPSCRLIIYAHVSGIYPPNMIPSAMFDFADTVILSTPASADKYINQIEKNRCRIIHEIGGIKRIAGLKKIEHSGFNIVYIGTASYSKLHLGFIQACRRLLTQVPDVRFIVASNDDNSHLRAEADEFNISNKFDFSYRTNDIESILSSADLFGYPLRPDHFGTGEQALLEAMGAGVPPVVLGNPAEKSLIEDGVTGFIASDIYDYVAAVQYCLSNPELIRKTGEQARISATKKFSEYKTIALFDELYRHSLNNPKKVRHFDDFISYDNHHAGWSLFKLSIGENADISSYENADDEVLKCYFRNKITRSIHMMSENKGGMKMYHKYFPDDTRLNQFVSYV